MQLRYKDAIDTIVQFAQETMDDCQDVVMPEEGSDAEAVQRAALVDALERVFVSITKK